MKRNMVPPIIAAMLCLLLITPATAEDVATDSLQEEIIFEETGAMEETQVLEEAEVPAETKAPEETGPLKEDVAEDAPAWSLSSLSSAYFGDLLTHLVYASEGNKRSKRLLEAELAEIQAVSEEDYALAKSIVENWQQVFLDPAYTLYLYDEEDVAQKLEGAGIPNDASHAIVVLGYELLDGEMQGELKGRCEAAAALAKAFPETILLCSGGATGENNVSGNTEAGLMKAYLTENCDIDASRIFIDEQAMTTADNAMNTFRMMKEQLGHSLTLVTSTYHMAWAQAVYFSAAQMYRLQQGYDIESIANFCYDIEPSVEMYKHGNRIAAFQVAGIIGLPEHVIQTLPSFFGAKEEVLSTTEYAISF